MTTEVGPVKTDAAPLWVAQVIVPSRAWERGRPRSPPDRTFPALDWLNPETAAGSDDQVSPAKASSKAIRLRAEAPGCQDFVGLGWFCAGRDKEFRFGHTGMNEGFTAEMRLFPAVGKGAVVMLNSFRGGFLRNELLDAIGREYRRPVTASSPVPISMTTKIVFDGPYRSEHGASVQVTRDAEDLLFQYDQQNPLSLFPTVDGEFFTRALPLRVRFDDANAARPNGLSVVFAVGRFALCVQAPGKKLSDMDRGGIPIGDPKL